MTSRAISDSEAICECDFESRSCVREAYRKKTTNPGRNSGTGGVSTKCFNTVVKGDPNIAWRRLSASFSTALPVIGGQALGAPDLITFSWLRQQYPCLPCSLLTPPQKWFKHMWLHFTLFRRVLGYNEVCFKII